MDLVTLEKNPVYAGELSSAQENAKLQDNLQLLVFSQNGKQFGIDLREVQDVIREARLNHPDATKPSIIPGIIRRNRRNAIVFNLNRCLKMQWGFDIDERRTGILMLEEKMEDSSLGILVNGITSIVTMKHPRPGADAGTAKNSSQPIHGIIRKSGLGEATRSAEPIIWIDTRALVNNCTPDTPYAEGDSESGWVAT